MSNLRNWVAGLILAAVAVAIFLPLPGEDTDHLLTEDEASDTTLTILTDSDLFTPLIAQFEADTRLETRVIVASPEKLQDTEGDLLLLSDSAWMALWGEQKLLDSLPAYLTNGVPPVLVKEFWAGVSVRTQWIVYNPQKVTPTTLPKNLPELDSLEQLQTGKVEAALVSQMLALQSDLAMTLPENFEMTVTAVAILANADSKPLAQQFISYLYFSAGQTYFRDVLLDYPVMTGVESNHRLIPLADLLLTIESDIDEG